MVGVAVMPMFGRMSPEPVTVKGTGVMAVAPGSPLVRKLVFHSGLALAPPKLSASKA
jgi:hypothetical protein